MIKEPPLEEIRALQEKHLPRCLYIIQKSFATVAKEFSLSAGECPSHPAFMPMQVLRKRFAEKEMFGLFLHPTLVAVGALSPDGFLHNLAVLPAFRHRGYAGKLLLFCEARHAKNGGQKLSLEIMEENIPLKCWYINKGYRHIGKKTFAHLPFTVGCMEKKLP